MSWAFLYYLISIVGGVDIFCSALGVLTIIFTILWTTYLLDEGVEDFIKLKKYTITVIITGIFFLIVSILIPDKTDLLIISGLKMSEKPITGIVEEYSPKLKILIDRQIDELLKDNKK